MNLRTAKELSFSPSRLLVGVSNDLFLGNCFFAGRIGPIFMVAHHRLVVCSQS